MGVRQLLYLLCVLSFSAPDAQAAFQDLADRQLNEPNSSNSISVSKDGSFSIQLHDQQIIELGRGMSQVFLLSKDDEVHDAGTPKKIIRPSGTEGKDLAYLRVYFVGRKGEIEKAIIVLVSEHDTADPKFYIDQNNNLDFSDDGETVADISSAGNPILRFKGSDTNSTFAIELIPFRNEEDLTDAKKAQYREMFEGLRGYMGGEYADTDDWFYNRRLNTRTNSVSVGGLEVLIGLHDYDCDGLYDGEVDRLVVGTYGAKNVSFKLADGAVNTVMEEIFMIQKTPFRIVEVAADGSRVQIEKSDEMPDRLFIGSQLPKINVKSFDGASVSLDELVEPEKWLVLDFWGHWCGPCVAAIPKAAEFHDKWKKRVTFIGVHHGDHDAARKLVTDKAIAWPQFEFNDHLKEQLFVDAWPTYMLIDSEGTILSFHTSLKEIEERLAE